MSEKISGGRFNRISPSTGRGSIVAYSPLSTKSDMHDMPGNNVLAIPLSAIQTNTNTGKYIFFDGPSLTKCTHQNTFISFMQFQGNY